MLQLSSSSNRLRESVADFDELAAVVSAEATEAFVKVNMSGPLEALRGGVVANECDCMPSLRDCNQQKCRLCEVPDVIDSDDRVGLNSAERYLLGTTLETGRSQQKCILLAQLHVARHHRLISASIPFAPSLPFPFLEATTPNMLKKE